MRAFPSIKDAIEYAPHFVSIGSPIVMMLGDLNAMGSTHNPADLVEVRGIPIVGDSAIVVVVNPMLFTAHFTSPKCRDWYHVKPAWRRSSRLDGYKLALVRRIFVAFGTLRLQQEG